jgi:hypothetical protein
MLHFAKRLFDRFKRPLLIYPLSHSPTSSVP